MRQPIQRVVNIRDRVPVAIYLSNQVAGIVARALGVARGEVGFLHPANLIALEAGGVAVGIGDAHQVVLVVVADCVTFWGRGQLDLLHPVSQFEKTGRITPALSPASAQEKCSLLTSPLNRTHSIDIPGRTQQTD